MIRYGAAFLVRVFVELGLVLFLFAGIFFVLAFRLGRRFVTPTPDRLDRLSNELSRLLAIGLVAVRRSREYEDELDELEERELDLTDEEREQSEDFWRSVTV